MYSYLLEVGQYALTLAATMWVLGNKNPTFAWFCGGLIVVQAAVSLWQGRLLRDSRNKWEKSRDDLVGRTGDLLSMRDVILAYEQQHHYENRLKSFSDKYADVERRLTISEQVFKGLSLLVTDLGRIGILAAALVASLATSKSSITTVGDVYFLTSIYVRLFVPVSSLLNRYDDFRRVQSTADSFVDLLEQEDDLHPAHQEGTGARRTIALTGNAEGGPAIQFDQVAFRYDRSKDRWILRDCTFEVPAGRTTLVVGRSGAGKTTIARIVLGYALGNSPLEHGSVTIKGRPLDRWSPTDLLGLMSYIAQGDQVVDETVCDNLFPKQDDTPLKMYRKLAAVGISGGHPDPKLLQQRARDLSGVSSSGWSSPECCWTTPRS
jgi:ABC-type multidrug transport system fused ATPase/permease subunit